MVWALGRDHEESLAVAVLVPQVTGVASAARAPLEELEPEVAERQLRGVVDRRRDLAGLRVGGDLAATA